jgi:hypothetical protein
MEQPEQQDLLEPPVLLEQQEQVPRAPPDHKDHKDQPEPLVLAPLGWMELQVQPEQVPRAPPDHKDRVGHKECLGLLVPLVPAA